MRAPELLTLSCTCPLLASSLVLHLPLPAAVWAETVEVEEEGSSPTGLHKEVQG
ncbi:hypothetical protein HRbin24_00083 [bacterium HR24]|nr:hypothetical protein HRbin24_00083 [bacterium HR24]